MPVLRCALSWLLAGLLELGRAAAVPARVEVDFRDAATYAVHVGGVEWLRSSPPRLFAGGRWHYAVGPDASLQVTGTAQTEGSDELGDFDCLRVSWNVTGESSLTLYTAVKTYRESNIIVFEQELPFGASRTNASNPVLPVSPDLDSGAYPPVVAFPAFNASGEAAPLRKLGFATWQGVMSQLRSGADVLSELQGLSSNGPVALFDSEFNTLVVSPLDNFKSAVHTYSKDTQAWEVGVSSELESLPANFKHRTLVLSGIGVTATMDSWGATLRKLYGTQRLTSEDKVVNYLSYWTDNGAYYYGDQWGEAGGGGETCSESAMRSVAAGLEQQGLLDAIGIWQLDDWWYPGHPAVWVHCVKNWTLVPPAFNHSLRVLGAALGKPWLLYVPFFCAENDYSTSGVRFVTSNPGPGQFAEPHPDDALPFYRALFDYGLQNGMKSFEHDFLNHNLLAVPHFRKNFGSSEKWLQAIDTAAFERRVPVQLCMSLPSDLMQSVRMNSATNYRASDDYTGSTNYDIGGSSILGFALGLRPSKDTFWTHRAPSVIETGKPWDDHSNPGSNCELKRLWPRFPLGPLAFRTRPGIRTRPWSCALSGPTG